MVEAKPVDSSLTTTQVTELFESECKKVGAMNTVATTTTCKCTNGLNVEMSNWKKNQTVLRSTCTEDLELETVKPAATKPEETKPSNPANPFDL
jgi:hypothetical protein